MSLVLADLLPATEPDRPLIGVEQEWQLWSRSGQLDFRKVLPALGDVALRGRDPGDRRATRLPSGFALTADGWEVELATPPVPAGRGTAVVLERGLAAERARLGSRISELHPTAEMRGFSTHVNVAVADEHVAEVAREFTVRFGIAAALLLGNAETPGLVVRARRGRLEVCGDYVAGEDLRAAVVFVTACATLLALDEGDDAAGSGLLPPRLDVEVADARERFGYYLDRCSPGQDLYTSLRSTPLPGHAGTAQDHLEECWACARPVAVALGLETAEVDARVMGRTPLPGERDGAAVEHLQPAGDTPLVHFDVTPRRIGDLRVEPAWLTWAHAAWSCTDGRGRTCHAVMPVPQQEAFLSLLDGGRLTPLLRKALRPRVFSRVVSPVLVATEEASRPGLWRRVDPSALVPRERPLPGRSGGMGGGLDPRDPKRDRSHQEPLRPRTPRSRNLLAIAAAGAVLVVVAGVGGAAALLSRDEPSGSRPGAGADSPASAPEAPPTDVGPSDQPPAPDLSGTYQGESTIVDITPLDAPGDRQPTRTERVRGRVLCDDEVCRIMVKYLTGRFRREITVPASGGEDRFSRPARGGDRCNLPEGVTLDRRAEGWVRLSSEGLRWRIVHHPDDYSTCPGGFFLGGGRETGTAERTDG